MSLNSFTVEELFAAKRGEPIFDDMNDPLNWMNPEDLEDLIIFSLELQEDVFFELETCNPDPVIFNIIRQILKKFAEEPGQRTRNII